MTTPNRNERWGRVLIDELSRCGVEHLVLSPGSRSGPVALAAARDGRVRIHVQIDERSAGFVALGVGKVTGRPGAVLTTSGTAAANLLPAVVEASQSEVPLLVLTADRPPRLRGGDANQTIDQTKLFGVYARRFEELSPAEIGTSTLRHLRSAVCRAVAVSIGAPGGAVHLNLAFDKPLEPSRVLHRSDPPTIDLGGGRGPEGERGRSGGRPWTAVLPHRSGPTEAALAVVREALTAARRPLLVAGVVARPEEVGGALRRAAATFGIPLLADPLSGARFPSAAGEEAPVVGGYATALAHAEVRRRLAPDLVLRVGAAPTSTLLGRWLAELQGVPQLVIEGVGGRWKDHAGTATAVVPADPALLLGTLATHGGPGFPVDPGWRELWARVEGAVRQAIERECVSEGPPGLEGSLVAQVVAAVGPEMPLFTSSSMPVRDLDAFVPHRSDPLRVLGNRGASGIDGIISTAAGVSLASRRRVVALVGDLALLHDANGLASLRAPGVCVTVVVINNDGGGIFHLLPVRDHEPAFTPYFATPHGRELRHLARLYELPHRLIEGREGGGGAQGDSPAPWVGVAEAMREVLALESSAILEIRTDREQNRRRRAEAVERIASAAADALNEGEP